MTASTRSVIDVRLVPARDGVSWRATVDGRPVQLPEPLRSPSSALRALALAIDGLAWTEDRPEPEMIADHRSRLFDRDLDSESVR